MYSIYNSDISLNIRLCALQAITQAVRGTKALLLADRRHKLQLQKDHITERCYCGKGKS